MRRLMPVAAGLLVIASSTYTLFTADPASLNFKIHVVLIAVLASAAMLGTLRKPS
ncbi:MAG TPA: hypothetical protein VGQ37_10630 [Vicinamibacterales bacterium]|nr:hypothetical protein [Vicinamibacterales bacterium]